MSIDVVLIPEFDGKEILEGLNFKSAVRVEEKPDETTWLVETLSGDKIIIVANMISVPLLGVQARYTTHHGKYVEEYARQHASSQSNSHHLLTQLI